MLQPVWKGNSWKKGKGLTKHIVLRGLLEVLTTVRFALGSHCSEVCLRYAETQSKSPENTSWDKTETPMARNTLLKLPETKAEKKTGTTPEEIRYG